MPNQRNPNRKVITIILDKSNAEFIKNHAEKTGTNVSNLVEKMILDFHAKTKNKEKRKAKL